MTTTAPTIRKQYRLRWLFAVTALVCVLLAGWRVYDGMLYSVEDKLHTLRGGETRDEVERILGKPKKRGMTDALGMAIDVYPGGYGENY